MKIVTNAIVCIDYSLTNDNGEILDSSGSGGPLEYLHGHGQIVPGLERELEGKEVGASLKVHVEPADGYGIRDDKKVMKIARDQLPKDLEPEVGLQIGAEGPDGEMVPLWITAIAKDGITFDGNHPLAGQALNFSIDIRSVRQATKQELEHGHAHGAHGHDH